MVVISEEKKGFVKGIVIGIVVVVILFVGGYGIYSWISVNKERLSKVKKEILKSEIKANIVYENEEELSREFTKNDMEQVGEMAKDFIMMFNERDFSGIRKMLAKNQIKWISSEALMQDIMFNQKVIRVTQNPQIEVEPFEYRGYRGIGANISNLKLKIELEKNQAEIKSIRLWFIKDIDGELKLVDVALIPNGTKIENE